MRVLKFTREQWEELKQLAESNACSFPYAFSTNPDGDIWPTPSPRKVPPEERIHIAGKSWVIDQVAREVRDQRQIGGRFFLRPEGAYWKDETSRQHKLMSFKIRNADGVLQSYFRRLSEIWRGRHD